MAYRQIAAGTTYRFDDLKTLMAKATPERSGDQLAGLSAEGPVERLAAQMALADLPLSTFVAQELIASDEDEVSALIARQHDARAFAPVASLTVGEFREWLLNPGTGQAELEAVTWGLTPEMVAAVSKIMRLQDLVTVSAKGKSSAGFATRLVFPAACPPATSRTIPPTIPSASPSLPLTDCCSAAAMR